MQFTKTPEQLAARRARVKQMINAGQVETDASRKAKKEAQKRFDKLENAAELILAGLMPSGSRQSVAERVSTPKESSKPVPEASRRLSRSTKEDKLAVAADKVLQKLLNS